MFSKKYLKSVHARAFCYRRRAHMCKAARAVQMASCASALVYVILYRVQYGLVLVAHTSERLQYSGSYRQSDVCLGTEEWRALSQKLHGY